MGYISKDGKFLVTEGGELYPSPDEGWEVEWDGDGAVVGGEEDDGDEDGIYHRARVWVKAMGEYREWVIWRDDGPRAGWDEGVKIPMKYEDTFDSGTWDLYRKLTPPAEERRGAVIKGLSHCPLCGESGIDLMFKFECVSTTCSNYKLQGGYELAAMKLGED